MPRIHRLLSNVKSYQRKETGKSYAYQVSEERTRLKQLHAEFPSLTGPSELRSHDGVPPAGILDFILHKARRSPPAARSPPPTASCPPPAACSPQPAARRSQDSSVAAKFIVVEYSADPIAVTRVVTEVWRERTPSVLLSITGGAAALDISPELEADFVDGLRKAALSADAWVFTGGTDAGVMALTGKALVASSGERTPCIGLTSWSKVMHADVIREKLKENMRDEEHEEHDEHLRYSNAAFGGAESFLRAATSALQPPRRGSLPPRKCTTPPSNMLPAARPTASPAPFAYRHRVGLP